MRFVNSDFEFREGGSIGFGQPIVSEKTNEKINELSLLYGKRQIKKGHSYSISIGISYSIYEKCLIQTIDGPFGDNGTITDITNESDIYFGIPFELNIKWFKNNKSKYRILGLIPVGRETSIGNSIGFKIFGNLSKNGMIGFGTTFGIGTYKKYKAEK